MRLLYQTHSPYARKVLVAAHELGIALEVIHHETSPLLANDAVSGLNPLGKVPVLVLDDGFALFDSDVICEYLDGKAAGLRLIPADPARRWRALRVQAVAQGIADAGIAARWESGRRPATLRWPAMHDGLVRKIELACDFLERELDDDRAVDIGDIAAATALSWIEFRDVFAFREGCPRLAAWYERFRQRPSMQATALCGATHDH
jgi:glutathione S-transferase